MMNGIFSRSLLALSLAVPAVALTACGDGGGDSTTGSTNTSGSNAAETGSADTSSNATTETGSGNESTDTGSADTGSADTNSSNTDSSTEGAQDLAKLALANPDLSEFVKLVTEAGLVAQLAEATAEKPLTVFAPTNAALGKVPKEDLDALKADKEKLKAALLHHVIDGMIKSGDLQPGSVKKDTKAGTALIIESSTDGVKAGNAKVVKADQVASNGVIHSVDTFIVAPSKKIGEVVAETPELSKLLAALKAAELEDTLNGQGPFTLFAPNNAAIDKVTDFPTDKATLEPILKYHVISDAAKYSFDLTDKATFKSFEGKDITIAVANGEIKIGESKVISKDIVTTNGVIHIVDTVFTVPTF